MSKETARVEASRKGSVSCGRKSSAQSYLFFVHDIVSWHISSISNDFFNFNFHNWVRLRLKSTTIMPKVFFLYFYHTTINIGYLIFFHFPNILIKQRHDAINTKFHQHSWNWTIDSTVGAILHEPIYVKWEPEVSIKNTNVLSVQKSCLQHSRTNSNPKSTIRL